MLQKVDRILLRVPQLAAAVSYYRDLLGLCVVKESPQLATLKMPGDGAEIVLHTDSNLPEQGVYFLIHDVRDAYKRRADLKFTFLSPPAKVARGYTATVRDPFGQILLLLDRTAETHSTHEDVSHGGTLFAGVEAPSAPKRDLLITLYEAVGRTADDLPYTPHFETLYEPYIHEHAKPKPSRAEVWRHLLNLRKAGKLPRLGEARSKPPTLDVAQRHTLRELLGKDLGKRDRLPYTTRFDELVDGFNKTLPRPLSPHLIWRAVATLAK